MKVTAPLMKVRRFIKKTPLRRILAYLEGFDNDFRTRREFFIKVEDFPVDRDRKLSTFASTKFDLLKMAEHIVHNEKIAVLIEITVEISVERQTDAERLIFSAD